MNTWSFFVASALLVKRLDALVSWLNDELNLDATESKDNTNEQK